MVFAADVSVLIFGEQSVEGPRDNQRRQMDRKQGRFEEAEEDVEQNGPGEGSQKPDILHKCHIYGTF